MTQLEPAQIHVEPKHSEMGAITRSALRWHIKRYFEGAGPSRTFEVKQPEYEDYLYCFRIDCNDGTTWHKFGISIDPEKRLRSLDNWLTKNSLSRSLVWKELVPQATVVELLVHYWLDQRESESFGDSYRLDRTSHFQVRYLTIALSAYIERVLI